MEGKPMKDAANKPVLWTNGGRIGYGTWITSTDNRQIAVFYGPSENPHAASDIALAVAAPWLLIAADAALASAKVEGARVTISHEALVSLELAASKARDFK
jgi:hypothetical protein